MPFLRLTRSGSLSADDFSSMWLKGTSDRKIRRSSEELVLPPHHGPFLHLWLLLRIFTWILHCGWDVRPTTDEATAIVTTWLTTPMKEPRYIARLAKIRDLERMG
jgi:hypothetical protein